MGAGNQGRPVFPRASGHQPEWYFLAQFQTLKLIPAKVFHMDGEVWAFWDSVWRCAVACLPFIEALLGLVGALCPGGRRVRSNVPRWDERGRIHGEVTGRAWEISRQRFVGGCWAL